MRRLHGPLSDCLRRAGLLLPAMLLLGFAAPLTPRPAFADILKGHDFLVAGDASRTRVVMQLDDDATLNWFLLRSPHRLVVDLPQMSFAIVPADLKPRGLVTNVRYGKISDDHSRMIFAVKGPFTVDDISVARNESSPGYRLVIDIVASSEAAFEAALAKQAGGAPRAAAATDDPVDVKPESPGKPFTIVIDPGHGGIDGGAEGVSGAIEKNITLAFGQELRDALEKAGKYRVYMTRDDDRFLPLDERVRVARQDNADLFISIHADTISIKGIRGATVYTVSDKASDAAAAAVASRENLSDDLAGVEITEANHDVADILVDLIRRETHSFSIRFARSLVGQLSSTIEMINHPHRFAGFRVLRAPDVPSVLVELGYLSNPKDEAELRDPKWRAKAVDSMCKAIAQFAAAKVRAGG
ncbi:MAG: N-acetylmuramoyl-L-alanine amidase [Hyphomicrobiales bacterium]|nr:N-acetylmuramoyl-L-alanine amidase [Hyphomicrobiales bacterium]